MSVTSCHHLKAYLLPRNGIQCKPCDAYRTIFAQDDKYGLKKHVVHVPPVDRLPVELLIEIFHRYLDMGAWPRTDDKSRVTAFSHTDSTPVVLTHVCGYWRHIVKLTPTLWSSLAIYNPRHRLIPLIRLWLECAGICPLSISIRNGIGKYQERQSATDAILLMLIDRCRLWKSIDFRFPDFQKTLMDISVGSMDMLVHASVDMLDSWPASHSDKVRETIHLSPQLASIEYGDLFYSFPVHTPWSQLRVLHCSFPVPLNQLLYSLQSAQNLEALIMRLGSREVDNIAFPVESIKLPSLKELEIGHFHEGFSVIFDTLIAPQLTTLRLLYLYSRANDLLELKNFGARSGFSLQTFMLINVQLEAEGLLEWLEVPFLSTVTDLRLTINSCINFVKPPPTEIHRSYLESVVSRLKSFLSCSTESG